MESNNLKNSLQALRAIHEELKDGTKLSGASSSSSLTPSLSRTTSSGSVAAGAKYISIAVISGSGTILNTAVSEGTEITFPYYGGGWDEIVYTLNEKSEFFIQEGR